jgi:hypothetical protein
MKKNALNKRREIINDSASDLCHIRIREGNYWTYKSFSVVWRRFKLFEKSFLLQRPPIFASIVVHRTSKYCFDEVI